MFRSSIRWGLFMVIAGRVVAQLPPVPTENAKGAETGPKIFAPERVRNLGKILEGDKVNMSWRVENRGGAPLIIENVASSCGCTVVQLKEEEKKIPAGGFIDLKAEFDSSRRRGTQNKTVIVSTNDTSEPNVELSFLSEVEFLYEMEGEGVVNLRNIRRGQPSAKTMNLFPAEGHGELVIKDIRIEDFPELSATYEPFAAKTGQGQRVRFTVTDSMAIGSVKANVKIKLAVDGIEREAPVTVLGEIVGDLVFNPKVIDATRQESMPGKKLAPLHIRSSDAVGFDLLEVKPNSLIEASFEPSPNTPPRTQYTIQCAVRENAPAGPFATELDVRTSSLDQPVIKVPVFGIVSAKAQVDPPVLLFRLDGTPVGSRRRLKVQASPAFPLEISAISSDHPAVVGVINKEASARYRHLRYIDVRASGEQLNAGRHETTLHISTNIPGWETIDVPVTIEVPAKDQR